MAEIADIWERPEAEEIYMIAGWRQWADAGSISSGLPQYFIERTDADKIGELRSDDFYLFQFPGTHGLVRPVVSFDEGYPTSLDTPRNELFFAGDGRRGVVFFSGDEPHLNVERYVAAFLDTAQSLGVRRIVGFGGVYGEVPYNRERMVHGIFSLPAMKKELEDFSVNLSDYKGGASIGSYICRRAGERDIEFVSFYAFVPTYEFSEIAQFGNSIRIENDYMAWLTVMRRVNYMLGIDFDLADLERKSERLIQVVDKKIDELDERSPDLGVREYIDRLSEQFPEISFDRLNGVWDEELRRLFEDEGDE